MEFAHASSDRRPATGPVTKWIVFAACLVITVVMAGLSAKLIDVQNNEASSWLPGSAESTKVVEELTGTIDPNESRP